MSLDRVLPREEFMGRANPWPTLPLATLAREMCLGKMLDKQKNRGALQPYLRNVNVRWFSFDLNDLKEMRFERWRSGPV